MRAWLLFSALLLGCGGGGSGAGAPDGGTTDAATGGFGGFGAFGGSSGAGAGGTGALGGSDAGTGGSAGPTRYWHRSTPPDGQSFTRLHGLSATDVWAVGTHGLAAHFDGTSWQDVSLGQDLPIKAVVSTSAADTWIATDYPGTIYRRTGASWQKDPHFFSVTSVYELWATSASDLWFGTQSNFTAGPAYHFNGSAWTQKPTGGSSGIHSIWGTGPSNVWAISSGALLYHDGTAWSTVLNTSGLVDMWGAGPADVWAVGSELRHYDGSVWSSQPMPAGQPFSSVWGSASNDVWAVGSGAGIWNYNGVSWAQPSDSGMPANASQVWVASPADVFVIQNGALYYSTATDCAAKSKCDSVCVDTLSDDEHCGSCNNDCGAADCKAGTCVCDSGATFCSGSCVDTQTDAAHCGACGNACPSGATCTAGACACPASATQCGNACVNTSSSSQHCGGCNLACSSDRTCVSSSCACLSSLTECAGACVDPKSDPNHCGSCGKVCAVACDASTCITAVEVSAGTLHTCARMSDASVRCWGRKSNGTAITEPSKLSGVSGAFSIDAGGSEYYPHLQGMCAGVDTGSVRCTNYLLSTTSVVPNLSDAVQVSVGFDGHWDFRCALRANKSVACWGDNNQSLGDGATMSSSTPITPTGLPSVEQISVGDYGACARTTAGGVWCWGYSSGSFSKTTPKDFGVTGAVDISVGGAYVAVVLADGTVRIVNKYTNDALAGAANV
ncbi:MAG TPA: hypothetical protein PKA88_13245, partial [Polyangiaceae bacterium]|nr:hypothetical protein [Polyangiaceae bacterium]